MARRVIHLWFYLFLLLSSSLAVAQVANVTISINSSSLTNGTRENIQLNVLPAENSTYQHLIDWREYNGSRICVSSQLNMPMEPGSTNSTSSEDYSSYENHGTVSGATFITGPGSLGGGYRFEAGDEVNVADSDNSLDITDELTIMAWINQTNSAGRSNYCSQKETLQSR